MHDTELKCAAQHFGLWAVQPRWMMSAYAAYQAGELPKVVVDESSGMDVMAVTSDGIGIIPIQGQITKGVSSYGGASSTLVRRAARRAVSDPDVRAVMLQVDSPGGTVDGTDEMAQDLFAIRASGKPIAAHVDGLMDSAALWAGVQAEFVSASRMSEVGSIGTLAVVQDLSGMAEAEGIKVHVISTGERKGDFVPGTEVTDEQLAKLQERVDAINAFFIDAVKRGRGMSASEVRKLATGEDWLAADAQERGLIDKVMRFDDAMTRLAKEAKAAERERARASNDRRRRMRRIAMN